MKLFCIRCGNEVGQAEENTFIRALIECKTCYSLHTAYSYPQTCIDKTRFKETLQEGDEVYDSYGPPSLPDRIIAIDNVNGMVLLLKKGWWPAFPLTKKLENLDEFLIEESKTSKKELIQIDLEV
jgi:hypothetical protein